MGKRTETFLMQKRKLIEVALPLEAINRESAREKSLRHGHPSTLHLWWARRPLAAARAVLFAQLVHDPSSHPEKFPTEEAQKAERQRLHNSSRNWSSGRTSTTRSSWRRRTRKSSIRLMATRRPLSDRRITCQPPTDSVRLFVKGWAGGCSRIGLLILR